MSMFLKTAILILGPFLLLGQFFCTFTRELWHAFVLASESTWFMWRDLRTVWHHGLGA